MKNVLFFGRPGCGKDTHGDVQAKRLALPHFVMSDHLRAYLENLGTPDAKEWLAKMETGVLVPDQYTKPAFEQFATKAALSGAVWNGYPRTVAQKEELEGYVNEYAVVHLDIPREVAISRIAGRAKKALDRGEKVRADDATEEQRALRQDKYEKNTLPVLEKWHREGRTVYEIDGQGAVEQTAKMVGEAISEIMDATRRRVRVYLKAS